MKAERQQPVSDTSNHDSLLTEQVAYYRARAHEYDEWFLRQGRYDRGPELNRRWFDEVEVVRQQLRAFAPTGHVLELACGTGLWTEQLLKYAEKVTAVDAAAEVLGINRARIQSTAQSSAAEYVQANLFDWRPTRRYDVVFFGFWLSHVPPEHFDAFWDLVDAALKPDGRVFLVDSRYEPASTAVDHQLEGNTAVTTSRRLNDGREFRIVKVFYKAHELTQHLKMLGWDMQLSETASCFIYGQGQKGKQSRG
jgi:demethylmenaquinone methyltransferase/2-methoxy-6-polyprenyl-1,4-benzoquinol methylase